ncbi:glycosyltransferase [Synechococcus sp. CBW1107]|uniref:glycosyltransferase n=1 Tax=Synechococcus sp. CBW1107 TaxID=2789857 RepID=UPI002AD3560D|nr:glycosyltransferase [Synechococcus sp. CBW1107]CAK6687456.1 N-acetylgalactosamine-N,N'-diacetylbacillosaminyl-diphospho-undecaprenol 4-alpha-N-acetylgalactosaminyltransferase [Synechococcus sp. CBW1107]
MGDPLLPPSPGPVLLYIDALKAGGAERITLQWAQWLRQAGLPVLLLTRHGPERDFYPLPAGLNRRVEPPEPRWLKALGWWGFPWRLLRLRRLLRQLSPCLTLGITTLPAIKLLLVSAGLPWAVVVSERNYPPAKPPALPWRWLRRLTYPRAAAHLVQTRRTLAWLISTQAVPESRCHLVPNPIGWPLADFPPRIAPAALIPAGASLMLAVGTKPHQKGFDRLLAAFARLAPRHPSWHLVILGLDPASGSHRRAVADLVAQWKADPLLRQRVHLPGPVGNVADWYGACDLFVLSSRYEGFPNVLLEAMVSGCACLACACPTGPEEIVRHGQDGWLVPAEADAALLERELERLIDDPRLRRRLGSEARAVRQRYGEAAVREQFLAALKPLMP